MQCFQTEKFTGQLKHGHANETGLERLIRREPMKQW